MTNNQKEEDNSIHPRILNFKFTSTSESSKRHRFIDKINVRDEETYNELKNKIKQNKT